MASSKPPTADTRPVTIVCVGMAGSGKTTFMQRINSHLHAKKTPPYVINLDPAVLNVPFDSNIDIRDTVNYREVMKQYNLGPNGGIMTALNLFATKVDQIIHLVEKRTTPSPDPSAKKPPSTIIVDTPGQIEAFVWSASGTILLESLASSFPTVIAYIIDTPRTSSTSTFISNMLYACSILYKTRLPMILVFNKTDVKDASFAKEWMTDYDAFQAAVQAEASRSDAGDVPAGSGYMSSLVDSMSLMLEEFYAHLRVVAVSSMTGFGVNDFFAAVAEKADEFRRDYQPDLDRRRQERDEQKMKMREKELEKLMKGISMEPKAKVSKDDVVDNDGSGEGSDEMDEDDDDDDDGPDADYDREGLQARYAAALASETEGSLGADASFAKYLHSQRQQQ